MNMETFNLYRCMNHSFNRGQWLGRLFNIKQASNQAEIYVARSMIPHIFVLKGGFHGSAHVSKSILIL